MHKDTERIVNRLVKVSRIAAAVLIIGIVATGILMTVEHIQGYKDKIATLEARLYARDNEIYATGLKVKEMEKKIAGLNQEVEQLKIKYYGNVLYTQELESRYLGVYSYANMAEFILIKQGIDFFMNPELKPDFKQYEGIGK
jgi:cytochrome bd-type quinol oxidase subunit 1